MRLVQLCDDASLVDHKRAVAEAFELLEVDAGDDDRGARVRGPPNLRVDLGARPDVDALRRLLEQDRPGTALQPAGQHDLLLVAARRRAHRLRAARADRESLHRLACVTPLTRAIHETAPVAPRLDDREVLADRELREGGE